MDSKNQRNILLLLILLLGLFSFMMVNRSRNLNNKLQISKQNNKALSDTVRVEKNKYGDLVASKNILVSKSKKINELNSKLGKELKKTKGKVRQLNTLVGKLGKPIHDTLTIVNEVIKHSNSKYGLSWKYDTAYDESNRRHIAGISEFKVIDDDSIIPLTTTITEDVVEFNLTTGLREKNGNVEIFATSKYPGFEVLELDGAIIDPKKHPVLKKFTKKKKWSVGPYIGIGFGSDLNSSMQVGVGVSYSLIKF